MAELQFESIVWPSGPKTDNIMPIDVAAHLEKLIFLHDKVVLPTFGAFLARRRNAQVDPDNGTLLPPSRTLVFDDAVLSDDGLLVNDIARMHQLDKADAEEEVHAWIKEMEERLNGREIVSLPGVGRLYKNYVQKVQFIPDAGNFNTDSFGLPPIQFAPLGKTREIDDSEPEAAVATAPQEPVRPRSRAWVGVVLTMLVLLVSSYGAFLWWQQQGNRTATAKPAAVLTNPPLKTDLSLQKQSEPGATTETPAVAEPAEKPQPVAEPAPSTTPPHKTTTRTPLVNTPPPAKGKTCILVVATLQDAENAERLKAQLLENGYELFYAHKNGHQVGVKFAYKDLAEIQQTIFDLQELTKERDIWIKQK